MRYKERKKDERTKEIKKVDDIARKTNNRRTDRKERRKE